MIWSRRCADDLVLNIHHAVYAVGGLWLLLCSQSVYCHHALLILASAHALCASLCLAHCLSLQFESALGCMLCDASSSLLPEADGSMSDVQEPYLWTGSDVRIREPDMPNIHFAVAFKGASWSDPDSVALMVMQVSMQPSALVPPPANASILQMLLYCNFMLHSVGTLALYWVARYLLACGMLIEQ